jgi:hypothetical protein
MLNNISWASYWTALGTTGLLYYTVILWLYYRQDIAKGFYQFREGKTSRSSISEEILQEHAMELMEAAAETGGTARIREMLLQLQHTIEQSDKQISSPETLLLIRPTLQLHRDLIDSPVKDKVINYIKILCKVHCSVHLSEEDISALWDK